MPIITPGSGGGGSSTPDVRMATLRLTAAQILALNTTPRQIVAAPGANKAIIPLGVGFSYTFVSAAYVTAGVGVVVGPLDGGTTGSNIDDFYRGAFLDFTDSEAGVFWNAHAAALFSQTAAVMVNKAFYVGHDSANPTGGDSTAVISMAYMTVSTV